LHANAPETINEIVRRIIPLSRNTYRLQLRTPQGQLLKTNMAGIHLAIAYLVNNFGLYSFTQAQWDCLQPM